MEAVEFVQLQFTDLFGISRCVFTTKEECTKIQEKGFPIVVSALVVPPGDFGDDLAETGFIEEVNAMNSFFYPDLSTLQQLPWSLDVASVFGDFRSKYNDATSAAIPICSRSMCKKALNKLNDIGLSIYGSFENEFSVLDKETKAPFYPSSSYCLTSVASDCQFFMKDIFRAMSKLNIIPEKFHAELDGWFEVTHKPHYGIEIADNNMRFKQIIKEIGKKHNLILTYMTTPYESCEPGTGHFNHSIWSKEGTNLFYDASSEHKLSEFAKHWIAGLQYHTNALFGLLKSTPNCLEQTDLPYFAYPSSNVWGLDNRSVCYRAKSLDATSTYVESRFIGSAYNPYLVVAGHIFAGLDGVKRKLELQKNPFIGRAELLKGRDNLPEGLTELPKSFDEGLKHLESSELFNNEFGEEFIKCFVVLKRYEMKVYQKAKAKGEHWQLSQERYLNY